MLAAEAGLPLIGLLVQPAQQRFAVIAGEGLQLIQQQLFPRTAQAPVTGCCCAERKGYPLSLLERASSDWPHALQVTPRRCHGRVGLLMQQPYSGSSSKDAMRLST
jgi:hypothetical protein